MFGAILKATNSSFQKGMAFCSSIYAKKVMKLLAFIFFNSPRKHHKKSPDVSLFPSGDHKAAMNIRESMINTRHTYM